ncbi:hypothetical protein AYO47_02750 [Planctomyces sp. SCGC AG-212-M04]|nr:hypothetical protein AYO47_02750 [Planctomyces sp. SCGC AG-212-M04]
MKISEAAHIGKKARCPKCRTPVLVPPPPDEFLSDFDSHEYEDLPYEPDPEPRKPSKPKKKKPKVRPTRRHSGNNPMARAGVVAVVIVGLFAGLFVFGPSLNLGKAFTWLGGSSGIGPDLTWLPDGVDGVGEIRVSQVVQTPAVTEALKRPEAVAGIAMMTGMLGFNLHDVESVRFGMFATPSRVGENRVAGVVKLTKPGRVAAVLEGQSGATPPGTIKTPHGSRLIYTISELPTMAVCCIDEQTILFGGQDELKGVLDKEGRPESTSRFAYLDKPHQIAFVVAPANLDSAGFLGGAPLDFKKSDTTGMCVCVDLDSAFRTTLLVPCVSSRAARQGKDGFDRGFQQSIKNGPTAAMMDPEFQRILSSMKSTVSGRVLSMTADFPMDRIVAALGNAAAGSVPGSRPPFGTPPSIGAEPPVLPTIEGVDPALPLPAGASATIEVTPAAVASPQAPQGETIPRPGAVAPPPAPRRPSGF